MTATMAEVKTVSIVPLNGSNYPTWKVQCRMAIMKDGVCLPLSTRQTNIESFSEDETEL